MNTLNPVKTIMTTNLVTVNPKDSLWEVKKIFDNHRIHHLPVVRYKGIVGLISKTDLLHFLKGACNDNFEEMLNEARLQNYTAEDIMTTGLAKIGPDDHISVAIEIFKENLFHAIPVVEKEELVGIITTYDIIKNLSIVTA